MAENENADGTVQEPQGTEGQNEAEASTATDWKAEARKWEARAKKSQEAEKELEELKAAQMTEQEKATKRAERAEAELSELKAKAERAETVAAVADKANVPAEVVAMLNGSDAGELGKQVERLLKLLPAYPTRTDDGGGRSAAKKSTAEMFADAIKII